jgi:hypothetical protein
MVSGVGHPATIGFKLTTSVSSRSSVSGRVPLGCYFRTILQLCGWRKYSPAVGKFALTHKQCIR